MRKLVVLLLVILAFAVGYVGGQISYAPPAQPITSNISSQANIGVYFSPKGGCTNAIVNEINLAKKSIKVQACYFTSKQIADALITAHNRDVDVEIILDKGQKTAHDSKIKLVSDSNIPTFVDTNHALAHNKIMIIDDSTIISGSFNFSKAAEESNAENLLIIKDNSQLIAQYLNNYAVHKGHSDKY